MKKTAAILLILMSGAAQADEPNVWVTTGFWSHHVLLNGKFNEKNTGLGFEYHKSAETAFVAGRYRNSDGDMSNYLGVTYEPLEVIGAKAGVTATILTGYRDLYNGKPILAIAPSITYEFKRVGMNVLFLPGYCKGQWGGVFAVQLKLNLF